MTDFTGNGGMYKISDPQMALLKASPPIIDVVGEVTTNMFYYVRSAVMYLRSQRNPEIDVYISSPGGDVDAGLDIYDMLRLYPGKKTAIVHDHAASMGALILQACELRQIARHSHVLIHHISRRNLSLDELRSKRKLDEMRDRMEHNQKRLYTILANRTGKNVTEIRRVCAKDEFMDASEALAFGLVDEIV